MALSGDLKAFLEGRAAIAAVAAARVHHNRVPAGYDGPYVWFARRDIDRSEDAINESAGSAPFRVLYDIEVYSLDGDEVDSLADAISALSTYRGAFGNGSSVQAIFLSGHSDEYMPRAKAADQDFEFATFQMEIVGYLPGD